MKNHVHAVLSVCGAVFLFGLGSTILKIIYTRFPDVPIINILSLRIGITAIAYFLTALVRNPKALRVRTSDLLYFTIFGTAGIFVVQYFLTLAVKNINVALATFVQSSATLLICAYSVVVLRERMSRHKIAALTIGFVGLSVIFWRPDLFTASRMLSTGLLAAVLSAVGKAFYILYGKKGSVKYDRSIMMAYGLLATTLLSVAISSPVPTILAYRDHVDFWLLVAALGLLCSYAPFSLYFRGLARLPSSTAGILNIIEPVAGTMTAFLILHESITLQQLIGCLLIMAGIVVMQLEHMGKKTDIKT